MMMRDADKKREQMMMFSMDDMIPENHMLRKIDKAIDWLFIYDLVEDRYCPNNGRSSMDPVMLIKIPFIQYLYGIKSMRQTMKEIEVNVAYRWFLGLDMYDSVPPFSTFGKNYTRRFKDTDLFEQIFGHILEQCMKYKLVDTSTIFIDATHVKAVANSKKMRKPKKQVLLIQKVDGFRYTQYKGKALMNMKAVLTFACMNLKKLAKMMNRMDLNSQFLFNVKSLYVQFFKKLKIYPPKEKWCWS